MPCRWRSAGAATARWSATAPSRARSPRSSTSGGDHPVRALLDDNGIEPRATLILRRVQSADGRTRAFVNDQPVSVTLLRRIGAPLVEIHGQHDDRALVDPAVHRALLDAFGGLDGEAGGGRGGLPRGCARRRPRRRRCAARIAAARTEADYLRAAVDELTALAPRAGRGGRRSPTAASDLMRAEKVAGDLAEAHDIVAGSASPVPTLASLVRRLERKRAQAGGLLDGRSAALDRALDALEEAALRWSARLAAADFDPNELERTEERLFALRAAARKHDVPVDDLPALAERHGGDLAALESGEERLAALDKAMRRGADALRRSRAAAPEREARRGGGGDSRRRSRRNCRR